MPRGRRPLTGRNYVCPDRLRWLSGKPGASKYEPAEKKYCKCCLNTSLVNVSEISLHVKRLVSSTCDRCGVLWADIHEDPKAHTDRHVRDSVAAVWEKISAKNAASKYNRKKHETKAFSLFYNNKVASGGCEKIPSKFSKMSKRDQEAYMAMAGRLDEMDGDHLAGTVFEGNDDRPTVNLSFVPSFLYPKGYNIFSFKDLTGVMGTFSHIKQFLRDKSVEHTTFQVDPPVTTDMWGTQVYVCYICTEPLDVAYDTEYDPIVRNSKVCTCSRQDQPTDDDVLKAILNVTTSPQTAVACSGDQKFLYHCNSFFSGYVIHNGCCDAPLKL